jgi:voltage-gated potassium channel
MKKIAVFGYSVMSLEVMKRLNTKQHHLIFISENEKESALIWEQGFETIMVDFRNDEALRSIGIGSDIDIIFIPMIRTMYF